MSYLFMIVNEKCMYYNIG